MIYSSRMGISTKIAIQRMTKFMGNGGHISEFIGMIE
jgi:hypothetical protein